VTNFPAGLPLRIVVFRAIVRFLVDARPPRN
jgi:hypothetical protein